MASPDEPARVGSALDDVNEGFHASYDGARDAAGLDAPVFVVRADELVVFRRGERRVLQITPRVFHVIKSVAHAPVALYAALHRPENGQTSLARLREHVASSLSALADEKDADREALDDLRTVLTATLAFADRTLASTPSRPTPAELDAFARALGPGLLRLTAAATRVQLAALDATVEQALAGLDERERRGLQVVVAGDHQARVRSLGMQYFQKRFREPTGAEERVTYAEGIDDPDEALALVGKRRLDNTIALAFFGDAKRLQRDVLGDAVHALLEKLDLPPI